MSPGPWPADRDTGVLFLLDASHRVEQSLLERWLDAQRDGNSARRGPVRQVVAPLAGSPGPLPALAVRQILDTPDDTLIVPLRVVWLSSLDLKGTTPRLRDLLFGNRRHPGPRRARRIVRQNPARAECVAAEPATLADLRQRAERCSDGDTDGDALAHFIADQAALALDIAERRLRGSRYKVPRNVAGSIRSSPEFRDAVATLARESGRPEQALLDEVDEICRELVSMPSAFWLDVSYALNRKIATLGYDSEIVLDEAALERVRQISRQYPTALLCTHKTHVDFPALNKVLFEKDFPPLHTMGGVNMAFAGLGFLARRAGVIFIRRSFQDDLLYKLVLRQYIAFLMQKRFPLSWAFEGTRSRVGKLMPPKYGILKYVIEAAHANEARKLHIIPVAINYDLINDVRDYAREQSGMRKQPESLRWFLGYLRSLKRPMGQIYLNFGEPIVLDEAPSGEDSIALSKFAFQVGVEANRASPITLASLATMILLGAAPRALTRAEFAREIIKLLTWVRARGIDVTHHFDVDSEAEFLALAEKLIGSGLVSRYSDGPEELFTIAGEQQAEASYYRNTTIHHFVTKAIAELALLGASRADAAAVDVFWAEIDRLRDLFKFEFFYTPTEKFRSEVRAELTRFDPDWEQKLSADAESGRKLLRTFKPLVAHATLTQFVEAYYVVADVVAVSPHDVAVEEKECLARCFSYGRQAYMRRRISSEASIGKLLFANGYKWLANRGLVEAGDAALGERRRQVSKSLRELTHRLQRIQARALPM